MPCYFTLRTQFGPHQDAGEVGEQLLRLVQDAPVDEIMFFFFGEELNNGHDTLAEIRRWIEASRPYRDRLRQAGIAISLNPWHTVLHCDRGRRLKSDQPWQRMVDPGGCEADAVVCCLDPQWQAYYLESLRLYAAEHFRVVWIDDDIRFHNHGLPHWGGCFCPLHVEAFNRRAGTTASRAEIVRACLQPGVPHPWRALWMDMWQETQLAFLARCRAVLDARGKRMGLMSSGMPAHAAEGRRWADWWRVFDNGTGVVHRPNFWPYADSGPATLLYGLSTLDRNRRLQPDAVESGPEIENFPYGPWNKSYRQTFAQLSVAQILGSTNLNISLFDFMGNRIDDDPERVRFLKRVRSAIDWLAAEFPMNLRTRGVGQLWSEDAGRAIRTTQGTAWSELQPGTDEWVYWLGAAGIATSAHAQPAVHALSGPMAWALDSDALQGHLSAGLLLDGSAAAILVERGFGEALGIRNIRWITQADTLYAMEQCTAPDFALRPGCQISVNTKPYCARLLQGELDRGTTVISDLRNPRQKIAGHGAFLYRNRLGGRIAVVPWDACVGANITMGVQRAAQLTRIVAWLADGKAPGAVEGGAWLIPQFLTDGAVWRAAVWNAGYDEVHEFRVHRPAGMPTIRAAWHLTPDGERRPARVEGDRIRPGTPLHQWEVVVLQAG